MSARAQRCVVILALLVAGCAAHPSGAWVKPGTGERATAQAESACHEKANAVSARQWQVDQDILATRERDWQASGAIEGRRRSMSEATAGRAASRFDACMRAKGFVRVLGPDTGQGRPNLRLSLQ